MPWKHFDFGEGTPVPVRLEAGWTPEKLTFLILPGLKLGPSVVLRAASRYTDCATTAHQYSVFMHIYYILQKTRPHLFSLNCKIFAPMLERRGFSNYKLYFEEGLTFTATF